MSGKYIVIFKKSATEDQIKAYAKNVNSNGGQVHNTYNSSIKGFSATIPESFFAQLQEDALIDYIEADGVVTTQ